MPKEVIIKKCYEVTYYDWWEIDHPHLMPGGRDAYSETVYAHSRSQAKYLFICGMDVDRRSRGDAWKKLKARRVRSMDWLHRDPHPLVAALTDSQLSKMKHAVGIEREITDDLNFYRNRYVVPVDPEWDDLIAKGIALKAVAPALGSIDFYYLSEEGKNVIISLMPIKRYRKESDKQVA